MRVVARNVVTVLLCVCVVSCTKIYNQESPLAPSGGAGDTGTGARIEYRVAGSAVAATIRYSNSDDGLTQVNTGLPWSVTFTTTRSTMYLSLDAQPVSFGSAPPFMSAQIFVNGLLLREASSTTFFAPLTVSATYRR